MSENKVGPDGAVLLQKALEKNTYLTYLDLSMNEIGSSGGECIAEVLAIPTSLLSTLLLYGNYLGSSGVSFICDAMRGNRELKRLHLGNNNATDESCQKIGEMLKSNKSLEMLDLRLNNISVGGMKEICKGLEQNQTLREIILSGNPLGPIGADELSKCLCKHQRSALTTVDLSSCNLGTTGGARIAVLLRSSNSIRELNLSDNSLDDESAIALASGMKFSVSLTTADLSCNDIGEEGASHLVEAINENINILSVTIHGNKVHRIVQNKLENLIEERLSANRTESTKRLTDLKKKMARTADS
ncbi:hypothetical protein AGDE_02804 [Angomonas deanei]|uniref:Leucine Rich repeat, putative n=1 Tax=Angomonas deanei TaxID=59799 RepID=S9U630_9TRYP|nr:hypothetical protein AGDE_12467 [Angomonas deanei]EPY41121.1 hypothetical protein AGDE_02804 [Angomonas deanei]CAD2215878.1 Leucine Rich repeat, putative [Angomonas deanei]|eukprot:EPY24199.1 hypothetical protein AGDE_12467 [Angomonas deanei]